MLKQREKMEEVSTRVESFTTKINKRKRGLKTHRANAQIQRKLSTLDAPK